MNLKNQKTLAAQLLKCGASRIWLDPNRSEDIEKAVTRSDVRILINSGAIGKKQKTGVSRGRARQNDIQKSKGRQKGHGSRRGSALARFPRKDRWIAIMRPVRAKLRELRDSKQITVSQYREAYMHAKGGVFKNTGHMLDHLRAQGVIKTAKPKPVKKVVKVTKPVGEPKVKKEKVVKTVKAPEAKPVAKAPEKVPKPEPKPTVHKAEAKPEAKAEPVKKIVKKVVKTDKKEE